MVCSFSRFDIDIFVHSKYSFVYLETKNEHFDLYLLQLKEFELYWGAVFLLKSVHTFSWFLSRIGVAILVTPKQEVKRKSEWFFGVNFFRSNFKVEWENGVWTKNRFLDSGFSFKCGNLNLTFTAFSIFWIGFFCKWFSQTIHSPL